MGVSVVAVVILALIFGRAIGFWLSYRDPVLFVAFVKLCGIGLLLAAGGYSLYLSGTLAHVASAGMLCLLYGVLMLLAAGITIYKSLVLRAVKK